MPIAATARIVMVLTIVSIMPIVANLLIVRLRTVTVHYWSNLQVNAPINRAGIGRRIITRPASVQHQGRETKPASIQRLT